jgi:hypothetical protein
MHRGLAELRPGDVIGPVTYPVSREANDRYWRAAGIEHPARDARRLFPPMAANLTILCVQTHVDEAFLHSAERLVAHRGAAAGTDLTVTAQVLDRYERRGREYAVIEAVVALPDGDRLWTSIATFTPAGARA